MRRPLFAFLLLVSPAALRAESETVVLLHGLGMGAWSMSRLEYALTREGYRVVNLSYPSRTMPLETLAHEWLPAQLHAHGVEPSPRVHVVTHSMGGIVTRLYLRDRPSARFGRVVMLAPPNAGSEIPVRLKNFPPFRWFTGVNGLRLDPAPTSLPRTLGPWPAHGGELGIIAGDRSVNPIFSAWIPGADDGKVAVASTHLAGERAHRVLHHSHPFLQWRAETVTAVKTFLRSGNFPAI